MRIDETQRQAHAEALRKRAVRDRLPDLMRLRQAEVLAGRLTGSPEWDTFLQVVQARRDETAAALDSCKTRFATEPFRGEHALVLLKAEVDAYRARLAAFEEVLDLPRQLREGGQKAAELLEKHGNDDDGPPEAA